MLSCMETPNLSSDFSNRKHTLKMSCKTKERWIVIKEEKCDFINEPSNETPQNKLTASDSLCICLKIVNVSLKFGKKKFFCDANCRISQGSVDAGTTSFSSINSRSLIQYENDCSVFIAQSHGDGLQYHSFVTTNSQSEKKTSGQKD